MTSPSPPENASPTLNKKRQLEPSSSSPSQNEPPLKKQKTDEVSTDATTTVDSAPQQTILVSQSEEQHGIKLYLSDHFKPLRGLSKQRRFDFHVHEIALPRNAATGKKEIAVLTGRDETAQPQETHEERTARLQEGIQGIVRICAVPDDQRSAFEMFMANAFPPKVPDVPETFVIAIGNEGEQAALLTEEGREDLHILLDDKVPEVMALFHAATADKPNNITLRYRSEADKEYKIQLAKLRKKKGLPPKKDKNAMAADYVRFVCFKENLTTAQATKEIQKHCKAKPRDVSFSGTKDKRGVTTQFMTVKRIMPSRLAQINKRDFRWGTLKVGTFSWTDKPYTLGDLWGNRFTMCLRKVEIQDNENFRMPTEEEIAERVEALKTKGFINYFGMQRFGTYSSATYKVGIAYLKGDIWGALKLILQSRVETDPRLKEVIDQVLEDSNYREALNRIYRRKYHEEASILGTLAHNPTNHLGAFNTVSHNIRSMYFHSYQSFIWNCMVTKRIEQYGTQPVVGDLVYEEGSTQHTNSKDARVKVITEEDLSNYNIFDVLMPLPGTDVKYPTHDFNEQAHMDQMALDGITIEHFKNIRSEYQLYGGYRNILIQPDDVTFELKRYTDFKLPLILSDMEKAKKVSLPAQPPADDSHPERCALIIAYSLPSSSYATMCNRELLHMSSTQDWNEINEKDPDAKNAQA